MKKVLIVAATEMELALLKERIAEVTHLWDCYILITGIGIMNTTFHLARLKGQHYDLVLQIGVGGVYKKMLPLGTVVAISQDQLLGLGAEDIDGSLIDFYKNGLMNPNDYPYEHGIIINQHIDKLVGDSIYKVPAITVLTSSGCEKTISLREQVGATVESMEGAAFHFVCKMYGWQFLQLRGISNDVEPRNKDNWQMKKAIINITEDTIQLLKNYSECNLA